MSAPTRSNAASGDQGRNEPADAHDLTEFGYQQSLKRTMGPFASFALAFSMVSIVTAIFFLFPELFAQTGGIGLWLWLPIFAAIFPVVLVYAHIGARIPLTGYAYQWNSRLVNRHYGWFSGWTAQLAFFAGTASIGSALANIFAGVLFDEPTQGQIILLAMIFIGTAGALNVASIRVTALVNNLGVAFELAALLIASVVLVVGTLFFFPSAEGLGILGQINQEQGRGLSFSAILAAAILPLYAFLGWEGAADLAEETKDPRRVTPRAMINANLVSVSTSFFMIIAFAVAIPHGVADMLMQSENPLIYIFAEQLGPVAGALLQVAVFVAVFACLLANMAVATRMVFSLSRDRMLPASGLLSRVSERTQTPIFAVILVCLIAFGINLLSASVATNIVSIVNVSYYATYLLTSFAGLYAVWKGRMPDGVNGVFSIGRAFVPLAGWGVLWATTIVMFNLFGQSSFAALQYFGGAQCIGLLWYLCYLRPRINAGRAGAAAGR